MEQACGNDVLRYFFGREIVRPCGTTVAGQMVLCAACEERFAVKYPQGWKYYPGDTCKHGVYVGGCGADYMCGWCESGEEPPRYKIESKMEDWIDTAEELIEVLQKYASTEWKLAEALHHKDNDTYSLLFTKRTLIEDTEEEENAYDR